MTLTIPWRECRSAVAPACWSCLHYQRRERPYLTGPTAEHRCEHGRAEFPTGGILCPAFHYEPGSDAQWFGEGSQ